MDSYEYERATPEMRRWFEETLRVLAGRVDVADMRRARVPSRPSCQTCSVLGVTGEACCSESDRRRSSSCFEF